MIEAQDLERELWDPDQLEASGLGRNNPAHLLYMMEWIEAVQKRRGAFKLDKMVLMRNYSNGYPKMYSRCHCVGPSRFGPLLYFIPSN